MTTIRTKNEKAGRDPSASASGITARALVKRFGKTATSQPGPGLNGFDLEVPAGSVCALLGPNGAGKTTAIRILSTLLRPDSGDAIVAGFDVRRHPAQVRRSIGLVGQYAAVDEILSGRQNLVMFGRLNHLSMTTAKRRADELLEQFSLTDTGRKPVGKYSGGMRRRLDLATSLIVAPRVIFVDEPTTGLDPSGRHDVWAAVRDLVDGGTTVLLTTQYMEEADQLADQVVMLKDGKVIATGTPGQLKTATGPDWLELRLAEDATQMNTAATIIESIAAGPPQWDRVSGVVQIPVVDRTRALIEVASALQRAGIEPLDLTLRRPTLDEVFVHLVGEVAGKAGVSTPVAEQPVLDQQQTVSTPVAEQPVLDQRPGVSTNDAGLDQRSMEAGTR